MTRDPVSTEGLGRLYGRHWALRDCTVSLPAGSVTGLVGANGAGKTTLLRLVAGLCTPTTGKILFNGQARRHTSPADLARVALLPQGAPLYGWMTVAEVLKFGRKTNPGWGTACEARCREAFPLPLEAKVSGLS